MLQLTVGPRGYPEVLFLDQLLICGCNGSLRSGQQWVSHLYICCFIFSELMFPIFRDSILLSPPTQINSLRIINVNQPFNLGQFYLTIICSGSFLHTRTWSDHLSVNALLSSSSWHDWNWWTCNSCYCSGNFFLLGVLIQFSACIFSSLLALVQS